MASNDPNRILAGLLRGSPNGSEQLTSIADELQQLRAINDALASERSAALSHDAAQGGTQSSGSALGSTLTSTLGAFGGLLGGFGLAPLISGIEGLFSGDSSPVPTLSSYRPPPAINLSAGLNEAGDGGLFAADAAQGGLPRPLTNSNAPTSTSPTSSLGAGQPLTIYVQAMDSKSFLDHSQDIANAVRQAMLETTVLNDVIREV
jgi:hypothetical protein